jgi:hypothetical protein
MEIYSKEQLLELLKKAIENVNKCYDLSEFEVKVSIYNLVKVFDNEKI